MTNRQLAMLIGSIALVVLMAVIYLQAGPDQFCLTDSCRLRAARDNLQNSMNDVDRAINDSDNALANYAATH
jgi:hypothetical protein